MSLTAEQDRSGNRPVLPGVARVALLVFALLVLRLGLPYVPIAPSAAAQVTTGLIYLLVLVLCAIEVASVTALRWPAAALPAIVATAIALRLLIAPPDCGGLWVRAVGEACLVLAAASSGSLLSHIARAPNILPPLAVTAAVVDIVGVMFGGFTERMLEAHPDVVAAASAAIPTVASVAVASQPHLAPGPALAFVGVGDFLFLGFFFAAANRFGFAMRASVLWACMASLMAMAAVMLGVTALPGLPFIVAGCILPNLKHFRYTRSELVALGVAALFVAGICMAMVLLHGRLMPPTAGPPK